MCLIFPSIVVHKTDTHCVYAHRENNNLLETRVCVCVWSVITYGMTLVCYCLLTITDDHPYTTLPCTHSVTVAVVFLYKPLDYSMIHADCFLILYLVCYKHVCRVAHHTNLIFLSRVCCVDSCYPPNELSYKFMILQADFRIKYKKSSIDDHNLLHIAFMQHDS